MKTVQEILQEAKLKPTSNAFKRWQAKKKKEQLEIYMNPTSCDWAKKLAKMWLEKNNPEGLKQALEEANKEHSDLLEQEDLITNQQQDE